MRRVQHNSLLAAQLEQRAIGHVDVQRLCVAARAPPHVDQPLVLLVQLQAGCARQSV